MAGRHPEQEHETLGHLLVPSPRLFYSEESR